MVDFLIGADPELFVRNEKGELVSAFGMIPGTKHDPHEVEGGAVQVDGMALEFNIMPASSFNDFNSSIVNVLAQLKDMIPKGYTFDFSPVADFGKAYIDTQPGEAKTLGCDPDFNAWDDGRMNSKPDGSLGIRTASGHIHIGWTEDQDITASDHLEACRMLTMQLDLSVNILSKLWDRDLIRHKMYGKMGAFRPKSYGVEYRVLSNAWVNNEDTRRLVYDLTMHASNALLSGDQFYNKISASDYNYYHTHGEYNALQRMIRSDLLPRITNKEFTQQHEKDINDVIQRSSENPFVSKIAKTSGRKMNKWTDVQQATFSPMDGLVFFDMEKEEDPVVAGGISL